ncbi:MAG TPA: inositol monophosphatase family protein, partial [Syntrophorhabdaceae bacterium]|nr:inositol monophosphatase family protein [Syntrophorhabdaceae bacterium]
CVLASGRIQKRYFGKRINIRHKGTIDLVTDVDMACQEEIIRLIKDNFPDDDIISEEKKNYFEGDRNRWIIDPLDGTTNYAHGYPFFCTSIAYEENHSVTIGVVYNPIFKELFYAKRNEGAYLNKKRISVSKIGNLKQALLSTGFPYDLPTSKRNNIENFISFIYEAQAIRRDGSAALNLCYLACGRFDGFWELKLKPWDMAAGSVIVEEAGGRITDFRGNRFDIYRDEIVASNGLIHEAMLYVLQRNKSNWGE